MRQRLDRDQPGHARGAQQLDQQQSHRSATDDRGRAGEGQVGKVQRPQCDAEGLQHRACRVGHVVGQRVQAVRGPRHDLAQHAVGPAVPGEHDVVAEVLGTVAAGPALLARDRRDRSLRSPLGAARTRSRPHLHVPGRPGLRVSRCRSHRPRTSAGPIRRSPSPMGIRMLEEGPRQVLAITFSMGIGSFLPLDTTV